jgi:hypothetical protein
MKMMTVALGVVLALAAGEARAESKMAKKFDAGPAIQGNSDPAMPMHKKKAMKSGMHKKAM